MTTSSGDTRQSQNTASTELDDDPETYSLFCIGDLQVKVPVSGEDREPRILDLQVSAWLGHELPNAIRKVVLDIVMSEVVHDGSYESVLIRWGAKLGVDGRLEFWLTENQILDMVERQQIFVEHAGLSDLVQAFATARQLVAQLAEDEASAVSFAPGENRARRHAGSRHRKPVKKPHGGLLDDPSALDRMYGEIGARLRSEAWFPILFGGTRDIAAVA